VKRLLRYLDATKVAWYHMEHTWEDGTSTMEHLIWIEFHVCHSKLHAFPSILKNGLRKDWIGILSQNKFMKSTRKCGLMHMFSLVEFGQKGQNNIKAATSITLH
jgi:hypothetical protein